jgi:hypothetical protein
MHLKMIKGRRYVYLGQHTSVLWGDCFISTWFILKKRWYWMPYKWHSCDLALLVTKFLHENKSLHNSVL